MAGLTFGSLTIPGTVQHYGIPSRDPQFKRTHFFGVEGESQITGAVGGRTFTIPMLVFDYASRFTTSKILRDFFDITVRKQIGKVGTLKLQITSQGTSRTDTYVECVLDGYQIRPRPGIIKDEAGTLGGDYICEVDLIFRQL